MAFSEVAEGYDWIQFDLGPGVTFEIVAQSADPEYDAPRYQVGFVVDDIRSAQEELLRRGVEPVAEIKGSTSYQPAERTWASEARPAVMATLGQAGVVLPSPRPGISRDNLLQTLREVVGPVVVDRVVARDRVAAQGLWRLTWWAQLGSNQ